MKFFRIKYAFVLWILTAYFAIWFGLILDEIFGIEILSDISNNYQFALMIALSIIPLLGLWLCLSNMATNQIIKNMRLEQTFD